MALPEEPYTRVERYLARLSGQNVDIPEYPITRIECYLDYLCGNGGGVPAPNAGAHNGIFRGQSLGTSFTSAQSQAITSGTFDGLFVGDYWTIDNVVYRVAGFDTFYLRGDTPLLDHHAVIVPDMTLGTGAMNESGTTEGGYTNSVMRVTQLPAILPTIQDAFGASHVLARRSMLCDAVSASGVPSAARWADSTIDLMSEGMVFGVRAYGSQTQNGVSVGERTTQLPLFALAPERVICVPQPPSTGRLQYWLQDVRNSGNFTAVGSQGQAVSAGASAVLNIRPYFCIA